MLKQSPGRNQRVKVFKIKHAVQISLLLAICVWLVYQLSHSHSKNALELSSAEKKSVEVQHEHGILKLGRRGLHPRVDKISVDIGRLMEKEEESEGNEVEGRGSGDEVDGHDQEKSEEESEAVEDLIDEDDTEREEEEEEEEEGNQEQESEEKGNALEDQIENKDIRYSQEAREDQYKGDDASQNIHAISSQLEIGSLRRVEEEEADSAQNINIYGQTYAGTSTNTSEEPKKEQWFSFWNRDAT